MVLIESITFLAIAAGMLGWNMHVMNTSGVSVCSLPCLCFFSQRMRNPIYIAWLYCTIAANILSIMCVLRILVAFCLICERAKKDKSLQSELLLRCATVFLRLRSSSLTTQGNTSIDSPTTDARWRSLRTCHKPASLFRPFATDRTVMRCCVCCSAGWSPVNIFANNRHHGFFYQKAGWSPICTRCTVLSVAYSSRDSLAYACYYDRSVCFAQSYTEGESTHHCCHFWHVPLFSVTGSVCSIRIFKEAHKPKHTEMIFRAIYRRRKEKY